MNEFNLKAIMDLYGLTAKDLAAALFPGNKYPSIALTRVINGEAQLSADQVAKLSAMTGVPIENLYSGEKWTGSRSKEGILTFENEDYKAELDQQSWITKIYHKDSLFFDEVIHNGSIPLSEFLNQLEILILNHKENVKNSN